MPSKVIRAEISVKEEVSSILAWNLITDIEKYPALMNSIIDVKVIERTGGEGRSEWSLNLEGAPFSWVEKDFFNTSTRTFSFEAVAGDFEEYSGQWQIRSLEEGGLHLSVELGIALGIPVIEEALGEILQHKMQENLQYMLDVIRMILIKNKIEKRKYSRYRLNTTKKIRVQDKIIEAHLIDVSEKGILLNSDTQLPLNRDTITLADITIGVQYLHNSPENGNCRLVFSQNLDPEQLQRILKWSEIRNDEVSEPDAVYQRASKA